MIRGHRNLPLLLLQAREAAMVHFRPILKQFGLSDQQWRIVLALVERALPLVERQYQLVEGVVGEGVMASAYQTLDAMLAKLARPIQSAVPGAVRAVRASRRK